MLFGSRSRLVWLVSDVLGCMHNASVSLLKTCFIKVRVKKILLITILTKVVLLWAVFTKYTSLFCFQMLD